jgi:hypothetical protein
MENIELLPILLFSSGIYIGYKILMKIKRAAIRVALIAAGVTQLGNSVDYQSIDTQQLSSIPSAILNNDMVLYATDAIYALLPTKDDKIQ